MEVVLALEDSTICIIYTASTFLTDAFCLEFCLNVSFGRGAAQKYHLKSYFDYYMYVTFDCAVFVAIISTSMNVPRLAQYNGISIAVAISHFLILIL